MLDQIWHDKDTIYLIRQSFKRDLLRVQFLTQGLCCQRSFFCWYLLVVHKFYLTRLGLLLTRTKMGLPSCKPSKSIHAR